jgi:DNA-binding transcriptional regulator/RsmH inhibitor MraZ
MLRGNYPGTVDEKGRVKVPADFLAELRKSGRRFYVTSSTGESARVYPMKVWEEIEKKTRQGFLVQQGPAKISCPDQLLRPGR